MGGGCDPTEWAQSLFLSSSCDFRVHSTTLIPLLSTAREVDRLPEDHPDPPSLCHQVSIPLIDGTVLSHHSPRQRSKSQVLSSSTPWRCQWKVPVLPLKPLRIKFANIWCWILATLSRRGGLLIPRSCNAFSSVWYHDSPEDRKATWGCFLCV